MIFHLAVLGVLFAAGGGGLWQANKSGFDLKFFVYLLPAFVVLAGAPVLVYQVYALLNAAYTLQRDGIQLRWGMRSEDIPEDQVVWVRLASEYAGRLPRPFLHWPGAELGLRRLPDGLEIEYLAAGSQDLVLIGTLERVYAISPSDPQAFLFAYQRFAETGSLTPLPARSVYPAFFLSHFWNDQAARWLLLGGGVWALGFLTVIAAIIPGLGLVTLHIELANANEAAVPAVRLLLLPVMNAIVYVADLVLGVFFYRRAENRVLSYLLWGASLLVSLLFSVDVVLILWPA